MPTVDHLFIGVLRTLEPEGQRTGLFKEPVTRAMIRRSGLVGDHHKWCWPRALKVSRPLIG